MNFNICQYVKPKEKVRTERDDEKAYLQKTQSHHSNDRFIINSFAIVFVEVGVDHFNQYASACHDIYAIFDICGEEIG